MSIPSGSSPTIVNAVTPYLVVPRASELIGFLTRAFGAKELLRHARPDGSVQHAEVKIGPAVVMMGEPQAGGNAMPATLHLVVRHVDDAFERAMSAGATSLRAPADQPQGGRMAGVEDPCGNHWYMASDT